MEDRPLEATNDQHYCSRYTATIYTTVASSVKK